jgi:hypothetical protein
MLALASTVILLSESRGANGHVLLLRILLGFPSIRVNPSPFTEISVKWNTGESLWTGQVEVEVTLELTVSQSLCQGIEPILGLVIRYYFLSEGYFLKVLSCLYEAPSRSRSHLRLT